MLRDNDGLIRFFDEFLNENSVAKEIFLELNIPNITEEMIDECISNIPIKADAYYVKTFVLNGVKIIDDLTYNGQSESFIMTI